MSEDDLFAQEMGKVQPLASKERVQVETKLKTKHKILRSLENQEINHKQQVTHHRLSAKRAETWLLRADGVASKDIKKLAQENIAYELDLHGLTQNEAIKALADFVAEAIAHQVRQICIVHGKGNHSKGKSVLKDTTYHWLEFGEFSSFILAATPAIQSKGGACNVLLRKQSS